MLNSSTSVEHLSFSPACANEMLGAVKIMSYFKQYRRKQIAELRTVTQQDIDEFKKRGFVVVHETKDSVIEVSIIDVDKQNGSPKLGDMIARNPKNHLDQWLVAEQYFNDNFEVA